MKAPRLRVFLAAGIVVGLSLGCNRPRPTSVEDPRLGIAVVFPGEPRKTRYTEPTPFSDRVGIDWYGYQYIPPGRLDEHFHVDVGNLPEGARPGDPIPARDSTGSVPLGAMTQRRILEVFGGFLAQRLGNMQKQDLPAGRGPGFQYTASRSTGYHLAGIVVLRGWRLHHAQATVKRAGDPRLRPFLDSFRILPGD